MNKQTSKTQVFKLRFKQSDSLAFPNWKEVKLNTLAKLSASKNKNCKVSRVLTNSATYGIVDQRDYFDKDIANKSNLGGYYIVDHGDYVYNPRISTNAPVGPISKNKIETGVMSPLYTVFRFINSDNDFYEQYFKTSHWHQYLQMVSNSGARYDRMSITPTVFMNMPIPYPSPDEQQKIADCLSSIDELITAQSQKLNAFKVHKNGLMQQLFPTEGESVPKLRFAEFRDKGGWKIRELGRFITERNQLATEKIPLFSLTIENGVTPKTERYERSFLVNNEENAYKLVCSGDFAYNPMNLRFGAIARHSGTEKVALSKYYNIFYCDDSVDSRFCEIYFKSHGMITHYNNVATGTLIEKRRVHFSDFVKFKISFPPLSEQQKIADCLFSNDELITAQSQKLDALKVHKKGLMQQLFPGMEIEHV